VAELELETQRYAPGIDEFSETLAGNTNSAKEGEFTTAGSLFAGCPREGRGIRFARRVRDRRLEGFRAKERAKGILRRERSRFVSSDSQFLALDSSVHRAHRERSATSRKFLHIRLDVNWIRRVRGEDNNAILNRRGMPDGSFGLSKGDLFSCSQHACLTMAARGSSCSLKSNAPHSNPNERSGRSVKNGARLAKVQRCRIVALLRSAKYKMRASRGSWRHEENTRGVIAVAWAENPIYTC